MALLVSWFSIPLAIAIIALSHALILFPTLRPNSQWLGPVVTNFATEQNELWLTIDDGPDPDDTVRILDLLDNYQARATFFVKGERVRRFREAAEAVLSRGHQLGNHSHTHPSGSFWCLPKSRIAAEIDNCNRAIAELSSEPSRVPLFRAPVGFKNPFVHPLLQSREMTLIGWSARGFDGVRTDRESIVRRIVRDVRPGSIILAHEGRRDSSGESLNYAVIEELLATLSAAGFTFVVPEPSRFVYGRAKTKR
ncbi:MAG: polysaccharide deacetylase family protein [Acidobacteriota bacterium]